MEFQRIAAQPLLDLSAVPWCPDKRVMKGDKRFETIPEVRRTIVHPSVIELGRYVPGAPRFILYYAPHHSDGIGAATAEELTGPWTPLPQNPILRMADVPCLSNHISGPDVIYVPEERRFRMYFHGSVPGVGQQSAMAVSKDGVRWRLEPQRVVLPYPYLRVFRRGGWYYGICRLGVDLGLVRSRDGIAWEDWPRGKLLATGEEQKEYDRLRHYHILVRDDTLLLYYCTYTAPDLSVESIKLASMPISGDWAAWPYPERLGVVLAPELAWEQSNLRDPYLMEADGRLYMFYVGGNEAGIGLARAE